MSTMDEQETTVNAPRIGQIQFYTNNPVHLRRLRKDERVKEIRGGADWGQFEVSADLYDPLKGFIRIRKAMTAEQRLAAAERLAAARQQKGQ